MDLTVASPAPLQGEIQVPGDKSITHRAIMIASLAEGESRIEGYLQGEDCLRTLEIMTALGVAIQREKNTLIVKGVGLNGLHAPRGDLDCGNSGTTMRLLTGLLSAQPFASTLIGDLSLSQRPMNRVILPLREMGFKIEGNNQGKDAYPPLKMGPAAPAFAGARFGCPRDPAFKVTSAQVKSSLLFAALCSQTPILIEEEIQTRDHTEKMLKWFGADIHIDGSRIALHPSTLQAKNLHVPGCLSSAAFFITATSMQPGAHIRIKKVGLNPRRMGFIHILTAMGAEITIRNETNVWGEVCGDVEVKGKTLTGIEVPLNWVASAMDEFPILFVACAYAQGQSRIRGIQELRYKESDRIQAMVQGLQQMGVRIEATDDTVTIWGQNELKGGQISSQDDHRIAMAFLMSAFKAKYPIIVQNCANIATSFPNFIQCASSLGLEIK